LEVIGTDSIGAQQNMMFRMGSDYHQFIQILIVRHLTAVSQHGIASFLSWHTTFICFSGWMREVTVISLCHD
jgi:hypothetical protein